MNSAPCTLRRSFSAAAVASVVLAGCGSALPSATPLSAPTSRSMARVRPSSARAIDSTTEDRTELENDAPPADDDDDDGDSSAKTRPLPGAPDAVPE